MSLIDLLAVGADPIAYGDLITAGDSDWFQDLERVDELLYGFKVAAELAGCAIPCGETPNLQNVVYPETLDLAGASVGIIKPKSRFMFGQKIKSGDCIYGLPSGGICSNGVSKARAIAEKLPDGYFTKLPNGRELGEELLTPTPIYVRPVIEMLDNGADLHYIAPITGHGWKKIARARFSFTYAIEYVPEPPQIFQSLTEFGQEYGFNVSDRENYQVWNMGVFLVLIAPEEAEKKIKQITEKYEIELYKLGVVEKGEKRIVIKPKNVIYKN
jgi:phosphoribosylformylglycinamidine cyclo-ligase